jgi:hypothetical protein
VIRAFAVVSMALGINMLAHAGEANKPNNDTPQPNDVATEAHAPENQIPKKYLADELDDATARLDAFVKLIALAEGQATASREAIKQAAHETLGVSSLNVLKELVRLAASEENVDWAAETDAARRKLAFRPLMEAETPPGWPPFTPVGEVELKQYPTYRLAIVDREDGVAEGAFFWMLFAHIQQNQVKMTAPVEMEVMDGDSVDGAERGRGSMQSMAFLYEHPEQGTPGVQGKVRVEDVAGYEAVVFGARGEIRQDVVQQGEAMIEAWLEANATTYRRAEGRAGATRVLGYNGPGVQSGRKFYEVQVRVQRVEAGQ